MHLAVDRYIIIICLLLHPHLHLTHNLLLLPPPGVEGGQGLGQPQGHGRDGLVVRGGHVTQTNLTLPNLNKVVFIFY